MRPTLRAFELGLIPERLLDAHPDYATMIIEWLAPALPEADFLPLRVVRGEALPEVSRCAGYLYSGSRHGVYEPLPWIAPLQAFVRDAACHSRPQFGICFGHQLIASALEGSARLHEGGWNCGVQTYSLEIDGASRELPVYVMHQDGDRHATDGASDRGQCRLRRGCAGLRGADPHGAVPSRIQP